MVDGKWISIAEVCLFVCLFCQAVMGVFVAVLGQLSLQGVMILYLSASTIQSKRTRTRRVSPWLAFCALRVGICKTAVSFVVASVPGASQRWCYVGTKLHSSVSTDFISIKFYSFWTDHLTSLKRPVTNGNVSPNSSSDPWAQQKLP